MKHMWKKGMQDFRDEERNLHFSIKSILIEKIKNSKNISINFLLRIQRDKEEEMTIASYSQEQE